MKFKALLLFLFFTLGVFFAPSIIYANWQHLDWNHRLKLTVEPDQISADQNNTALYVDLSHLPDAFFNAIKSDGSDILLTDANTNRF